MNQSHLCHVVVDLTADCTSCMLSSNWAPCCVGWTRPHAVCHFAPTRQTSGSPLQYSRTCSKQFLPAKDHAWFLNAVEGSSGLKHAQKAPGKERPPVLEDPCLGSLWLVARSRFYWHWILRRFFSRFFVCCCLKGFVVNVSFCGHHQFFVLKKKTCFFRCGQADVIDQFSIFIPLAFTVVICVCAAPKVAFQIVDMVYHRDWYSLWLDTTCSLRQHQNSEIGTQG